MSRVGVGTPIVVKPSSNVYTVMTGIATLVALIAVIVVWMKSGDINFDWFKM